MSSRTAAATVFGTMAALAVASRYWKRALRPPAAAAVGAPVYVQLWRGPPASHVCATVAESDASWARSLLSELEALDASDDAHTRSLAQKYYSAVVTNVCARFQCAPSDAQMRALELLQTASVCRAGDVWRAPAQRWAADARRIDDAKAELRRLLSALAVSPPT